MNTKLDDFASIVKDVVNFLLDLNKLIPGKVPQELIDFLNTLENSWSLELLANSLNMFKAKR